MQKLSFFLTLGVFISLTMSAQQTEFCGTDEAYQKLVEQNPELIQAEKDYEKAIQHYLRYNHPKDGDNEVLIIPVVFHILHEYGNENISDAQVYDAVNIMNRDFRKLNADTNLINTEFKNIAADVRIEFRLANIAPDGSCTNGINRIATSMTNRGSDYEAKFEQWQRSQYLNIWVAKNLDSGVAGFSMYPSSVVDPFNSKLDGIMLRHNYTGSIGTSNQSRERTLTHEVGHYLNLAHPWGSTNDPGVDCNDDGVEDTPITKGWSHCPNHADSDVCVPGVFENYQNYMDYSYCTYMFTAGQADRMRATLASSVAYRSNLVSLENNTITGVAGEATVCTPKVDFYANKNTRYVCVGETIKFHPKIANAAAETYAWSFPGANTETSNDVEPSVSYTTEGWKTVTLTAGNSSGTGSFTNEYAIYVYGESITTEQFVETFENENQVNSQWVVGHTHDNKLSNGVNWQWSPIGCLEPGSMKLNIYDNPTPEKYEFISPKLNLEGKAGQFLSFKYAFATQQFNPMDVSLNFRVLATTDCGKSRSVKLTINNPADILTAGNFAEMDFVPNQTALWKTAVTELDNSIALDGTQFIFEVTSNFGENNFYIDDINVGSFIVSTEDEEIVHTLNLYPNPANNHTHLDFTINRPSTMDISIYDLTGKQVKSIASANYPAGLHTLEIATDDLSAGAYIVHLKGDEINKSIKLMIGR